MLPELHAWQFTKDEMKIFVWIQAIGLGAFDDAIDSSTCCSSFGASTKQPVLSPDSEGADAVFGKVIGNGAVTIFKIIH